MVYCQALKRCCISDETRAMTAQWHHTAIDMQYITLDATACFSTQQVAVDINRVGGWH